MSNKPIDQGEIIVEQQTPAPIFSHYQAYLLRLWQETPHTPWRVSLQSTVDNERFGFSSLESLFAFLEAQTDRSKHATE